MDRWISACSPLSLFALDGKIPDAWQRKIVHSIAHRILILAARQIGKSEIAAAIALSRALMKRSSLIIIVSRTEKQAKEILRKILRFYRKIEDRPKAIENNVHTLELENQSRLIVIPARDPGSVRSYAAPDILILDEAAWIPDDVFLSIIPLLTANPKCKLIAISTPFGKRGWFFDQWEHGEYWEKHKITIHDCPRIDKQIIEENRKTLGERAYKQEYECEFNESIDAVFQEHFIAQLFDPEVEVLQL